MKYKTKMRMFEWFCMTALIGIIIFITISFWIKTGNNVFFDNYSRDVFIEAMRIEMLICIPIAIIIAAIAYYFDVEAMFSTNEK